MKKQLKMLMIFISVGLLGCATTSHSPSEEDGEALKNTQNSNGSTLGTVLVFTERNKGTDSFITNIFINDAYMRIATSVSPDDFILFNRAEQAIYNVTHDDKTIFVIRKKAINVTSPIELDYQQESQPSKAFPKIDGKQTTHFKYTANGKHCYDVVVMPESFAPDALAAMREFRLVLAGEHATTVDRTPKDLLDACDLSLNIFYADKHLQQGLPIREWDRKGYQRFLKNYRLAVEPPAGVFDLPEDYKQYSIGDDFTGGS